MVEQLNTGMVMRLKGSSCTSTVAEPIKISHSLPGGDGEDAADGEVQAGHGAPLGAGRGGG